MVFLSISLFDETWEYYKLLTVGTVVGVLCRGGSSLRSGREGLAPSVEEFSQINIVALNPQPETIKKVITTIANSLEGSVDAAHVKVVEEALARLLNTTGAEVNLEKVRVMDSSALKVFALRFSRFLKNQTFKLVPRLRKTHHSNLEMRILELAERSLGLTSSDAELLESCGEENRNKRHVDQQTAALSQALLRRLEGTSTSADVETMSMIPLSTKSARGSLTRKQYIESKKTPLLAYILDELVEMQQETKIRHILDVGGGRGDLAYAISAHPSFAEIHITVIDANKKSLDAGASTLSSQESMRLIHHALYPRHTTIRT